jgi:hypothetical protein
MVAILGRMVANTGQKITYEVSLILKENWTLSYLDWKQNFPSAKIPLLGATKWA